MMTSRLRAVPLEVPTAAFVNRNLPPVAGRVGLPPHNPLTRQHQYHRWGWRDETRTWMWRESRTKVFAHEVRISTKCHSNHATFLPFGIPLISITYEIRTKSAKSTGSERIGPQREIFGLFPAWSVNRSAPKTPEILPSSGGIGRA